MKTFVLMRAGRHIAAGRGHRGRDRGQHAHQDEGLHDRQPGVDAGQLRGLRVATDGVHVAPESASRGEDAS